MTTAEYASAFDAITSERLRANGSLKWSKFPGAIGAWVAESDFGVAPGIRAALQDALDRGLFGYAPPRLLAGLQEATADWYDREYGWSIEPRQVRAVPDVLTVLHLICTDYLPARSTVVLPTPAYMPFVTIPPRHGHHLVQVELATDGDRWVYDLAALEAAFAAGGRLLILGNPHNPVGRVLEREELLAIAELVERYDVLVFSDEIHAPLVYEGHRHVPYASLTDATAAHTITATSASKAFNLPGLKCAQLIHTSPALARRWAGVGALAEEAVNNLGLIANVAAYHDSRDWLAAEIAYLDGNRHLLRDLLAERLPAVSVTVPEGTYLSLVDCRALELGEPPATFFQREAGVALTDGALCGGAGDGYVRFNLATPRPILEEAVARMAEAVLRRG